MAAFVVDSNVWISGFLRRDEVQFQAVNNFLSDLDGGIHRCHLLWLVSVEVCTQVGRLSRLSTAIRVRAIFDRWTFLQRIAWYDLNSSRTRNAIDAAHRYSLTSADAIIAALADELGLALLTFDGLNRTDGILSRYPNARTP